MKAHIYLIKFCFRHNNTLYSKELPKFTWFRSPIPSRLKEVDTVVLESMVGVTNEAIIQMLAKQAEMLAQFGNRLDFLEEERREKPQQDKEGEEDEVNHGKNGKINKIAVKIAMIKEKMEKMQQAFHKAQGMDDFLYTMVGLVSTPLMPLPPKFKISDAEKFDGSGNPRQHI